LRRTARVAKKVEVLAKKGSQKWLQVVVNETPDVLNAQIITQLKLLQTETITWLSPLAADDFAEYQDQTFLDLLQIKLPNVSLKDFWPTRGPVWDGLARSENGKVFLIEAKEKSRGSSLPLTFYLIFYHYSKILIHVSLPLFFTIETTRV
jgi:hypothetical protein